MKKLAIVISALPLVACASVTTGTTQALTVDTPYAPNAECELQDTAGGHWYAKGTPTTVTVNKGNGPMTIKCSHAGFMPGVLVLDEKFQGATLGNILLGGGIGVIVDASTGAAQEYPKQAKVYMEKEHWSSAQERQQWVDEKLQYERLLAESYKQNKGDNSSVAARRR